MDDLAQLVPDEVFDKYKAVTRGWLDESKQPITGIFDLQTNNLRVLIYRGKLIYVITKIWIDSHPESLPTWALGEWGANPEMPEGAAIGLLE